MNTNNSVEYKVQKYYAEVLQGEMETYTEAGHVDIETDSHVIEVKTYKKWKYSLGQCLAYAHCTGKKPAMILYDHAEFHNFELIQEICEDLGVEVYLSEV